MVLLSRLLVLAGVSSVHAQDTYTVPPPLLAPSSISAEDAKLPIPSGKEWDSFHGQLSSQKYSPLTQINKDNVGKSELVLSITPRIVRNLPYQSPSDMEFPTGTETSMHIQAPERGMEPATRTEIINSPMAASTQVFVEKP